MQRALSVCVSFSVSATAHSTRVRVCVCQSRDLKKRPNLPRCRLGCELVRALQSLLRGDRFLDVNGYFFSGRGVTLGHARTCIHIRSIFSTTFTRNASDVASGYRYRSNLFEYTEACYSSAVNIVAPTNGPNPHNTEVDAVSKILQVFVYVHVG